MTQPSDAPNGVPTAAVLDTLSYVKRFAGTTLLVKLGGAALQDSEVVASLCADFALMRSVGVSLVLVHGGGPSINEELTLRGIEWSFVEGQRVTTPEMMDVVEMTLCGKVNRRIVRTLNAAGVRAVGLSGSDAGMLQCTPASAELVQVGRIEEIDPSLLRTLLDTQKEAGKGSIPVIAPIGVGQSADSRGTAYNINADWAASLIARALGIQKLIYLTDQPGILDGAGQLLPELDAGELEGLIEKGIVKGGMLAKTRTILEALGHGVNEVHVLNARRPHVLIEELFTARGVGTICRSRSRGIPASSHDGGLS